MHKRKFKGKLSERREMPPDGLNPTEIETQEKFQEWFIEDYEKLMLLCDEYGIDQDSGDKFYLLSWALAQAFVPGFQIKRASGPKSKWTWRHKGAIVVEIERTIATRNCTVSEAAEILSASEPWLSFVGPRQTHDTPNRNETLRRTYNGFRNDPLAKTARGAFEYCNLRGQLDKWDASVQALFNK